MYRAPGPSYKFVIKVTSMVGVTSERKGVVSTGAEEMDKKLGGGIPQQSLTLIEGQSSAGKSVLCQHLANGSLRSGLQVAYYTTENTVKSLLSQSASLGLDVTDYFLTNWLRVFPLSLPTKVTDAELISQVLLNHVAKLPDEVATVIIDSITTLVGRSEIASVIDYFASAKKLCDRGKTIFIVAHASAFDEETLIRVRSLCDAHLRLRLEEIGEQLVKVMEVAKVRNAEKTTGNIVSFDVEPGLGMRIIPVSKAKA